MAFHFTLPSHSLTPSLYFLPVLPLCISPLPYVYLHSIFFTCRPLTSCFLLYLKASHFTLYALTVGVRLLFLVLPIGLSPHSFCSACTPLISPTLPVPAGLLPHSLCLYTSCLFYLQASHLFPTFIFRPLISLFLLLLQASHITLSALPGDFLPDSPSSIFMRLTSLFLLYLQMSHLTLLLCLRASHVTLSDLLVDLSPHSF